MDDELLSYNPRDTYLKSLKADIEDYKTRDKIIVQSSVSDSNDITYATVDGEYCAYVDAYYFPERQVTIAGLTKSLCCAGMMRGTGRS